MFEVVLRHTYNNARATDVSGHGNHGQPIGVTPGAGSPQHESSLRFDRPESEVRIPRSPSLTQLDAIRLQVRFQYRPGDRIANRHNLCEGQLSFALFVNPHGGLMCTILDSTGAWRGITVGPGAIDQLRWYTVEMRHDGFTGMELYIDGNLVGAAHDVPGPVRGVGPRGISVGHWPEPAHVYTLQTGFVDEVVLAKRKLDPEDVLDACCADLPAIDALLDGARAEGLTDAHARERLQQAKAIEARVRNLVIGGDADRAVRAAELASQGAAAMAGGDVRTITGVLGRTFDFMRERASEQQIRSLGGDVLDLVSVLSQGALVRDAVKKGTIPDLGDVREALAALCLPTPPADEPPPRRQPHRDGGDPHTDRTPGAPTDLVDDLDDGSDDPEKDTDTEAEERRERDEERRRRAEEQAEEEERAEARTTPPAKPKRPRKKKQPAERAEEA